MKGLRDIFLKKSPTELLPNHRDAPNFLGIDVEDGNRKWKGGRYGAGQLALLPDQDLLLVLSENGELALVEATSEKFF